MMNSLFIGTLTFLFVAPDISICDEDLNKATTSAEQQKDFTSGDFVTQHPFDSHHMQSLHDPWSFYRQIRAPSGFVGMRGKKFYHSMVDEVRVVCSQLEPVMTKKILGGLLRVAAQATAVAGVLRDARQEVLRREASTIELLWHARQEG